MEPLRDRTWLVHSTTDEPWKTAHSLCSGLFALLLVWHNDLRSPSNVLPMDRDVPSCFSCCYELKWSEITCQIKLFYHKLFLVDIWSQEHWGDTEICTRSGVTSVTKHDHLVLKPLKLAYGRDVERVGERARTALDFYKQSLLVEDPDASRNTAGKHCTHEVSEANKPSNGS